MSEYGEEEFGRIYPKNHSEDISMSDAFDDGEPSPQLFRNAALGEAQDVHDEMAVDPDLALARSQRQTGGQAITPEFIIAVDFGTTFSSVAVVCVEPGQAVRFIEPASIRCIDNYPDMPPGSATINASNPTVPTELLIDLQKAESCSGTLPETELSDNESSCSLDELWNSSATSSDANHAKPLPQNEQAVRQATAACQSWLWGWAVHSRLVKSATIAQEMKHMKNFKLHLDETVATAELRRSCSDDLKALKRVKIVDLIIDYLTKLFQHVRIRLDVMYRLRADASMEFVLCVPTGWSDKACRVMQKAMTEAITASEIIRHEGNGFTNLFIVAESEAAAAHALDGDKRLVFLSALDSFLLLDCGGGTVDAITYTLTQRDPTRLKEVIQPEGIACGSSLLNERYRNLLKARLEDAKIVGNKTPLHKIIESKVFEFETDKRRINIVNKKAPLEAVYIEGLQPDDARGFKENLLILKWREMYEVFKPIICGVAELMLKQLNAAKGIKVNVQYVVLNGGFGGSPSLKTHLEKVLLEERNLLGEEIELSRPDHVESAVARGAVLRALRKEDGPERKTRSSYGVLRTEPYDDKKPHHRRARVFRDPADGEVYIKDTISWVLDKGTPVPARKEIRVESRHIFKLYETKFLCEEILYVSSNTHESGYKVRHPVNKGAEEVGRIVVDLTFLKTENRILPTVERNAQGKILSFYEFIYDLWIIIQDRTMTFEARSPINKDEVRNSASFSIAAGFIPGTA